jgi:hypothetical protein
MLVGFHSPETSAERPHPEAGCPSPLAGLLQLECSFFSFPEELFSPTAVG